MLNKPKFMIPSTNMQECTIDVSDTSVFFSCIVDGNEAINAWQIIIYSLDDGEKVFDSNKVSLPTPFFPVDEKNRNVVFDVDLKTYLGEDSTFVNRKQAYYWTITFWGTSGVSTTSCEEVFYASKKPTLDILFKANINNEYDILTDGVILQSRSCVFKGQYTQPDGVQLKRYGWRLLDTDNGQILIDTITHNQVYGTSDNIVCDYNGFLNDGNYSVELYVETQDNTVVTTQAINFAISYNTTFLDNDIKVVALDNEPSVMLDWAEAVVIGGRSDGDISFIPNYPIIDYASENPVTAIDIPDGSSVVFDYGSNSNLDIDENCYIVLSTQLKDTNETTLFYAEGTDSNGLSAFRKLLFHNGRFEYVVGISNGVIATSTYPPEDTGDVVIPNQYVWYILTMSPMLIDESGKHYTELIVTESKLINGLYPSASLYPKEGLYPSAGVWDKLKEEVE